MLSSAHLVVKVAADLLLVEILCHTGVWGARFILSFLEKATGSASVLDFWRTLVDVSADDIKQTA